MKISTLFNLIVFLSVLLSDVVVGQVLPNGQQGGRLKWLRHAGGNEINSQESSALGNIPSLSTSLNPFDEVAQALRVVIHCKDGMDQEQCLQAIFESNMDNHTIQVIHKLDRVNSIVVKLHPAHMTELTGVGFEVRQDPIRKPLHIKESLRHHRRLPNNNGPGGPGNQNAQQTPYGIAMVRAMESWTQFGIRGKGVKVCMIDTGIDAQHEDFASYQLSGDDSKSFITPWSQDNDGHGTHTSGTINAKNNTIGVVGVAPGADMYMIRVFDNQGNFYGSDLVAAADACASAGAKVISMSLGGSSYDPNEDATFQALYSQGILSVAAGGNDGDTSYSYPASYSNVISVAAIDSTQSHAYFSNVNDRIDLSAPGA